MNTKQLETFFKRTNCGDIIHEAVVNSADNKLSMITRDPAGIVLVNVEMKSDFNLGKLGFLNMKDMEGWAKMPKTAENITVRMEGNTLILQESKGNFEEIILADEKSIETEAVTYPDTTTWGLTWETIDSTILKTMAARFEKLKTYMMDLKMEAGELIITAGDGETNRSTRSIKVTSQDTKRTKIGDSVIPVIAQLGDKVRIGLGTDVPLVLESVNEDVVFKAIIAPRV